MKSNFYWIKVGLLIGLGTLLVKFLLPVGIIAVLFALPILVVGFVARSLGKIVGHFKLKHGWAERNQRAIRP